MGNDRYTRGSNPQGDDYGRASSDDQGRSGGGNYGRSSARDYQAAGMLGDRPRQDGGYGTRDDSGYGGSNYGGSYAPRDDDRQREQYGRDGRDYYGGRAAPQRGYGRQDEDRQQRDQQRQRPGYEQQQQQQRGGYGRQPEGYDYEDRGFLARAGDEVRSWFGDDDAERRREADSRYDDGDGRGAPGQGSRYARDHDYHSWRSAQIASLDRDYEEYRREHQTKFHNEFSSWRTSREGQRAMLAKVEDHMEVLGTDGVHVGTVDKVRGDRILLTKNDKDAGGRHHSIPSTWIASVDDKVTLAKTADDAKAAWKTEERQAMFGDEPQTGKREDNKADGIDGKGHVLNKSFPGTC